MEKDLKQIAIDLLDGKIFCDRMLTEPNLMSMVFMPIVFGAFKELSSEQLEDIGMLYEYYSEAGPRGINGNPIFYSFRILTREETAKMVEYYEEYKRMKEQFKSNMEG